MNIEQKLDRLEGLIEKGFTQLVGELQEVKQDLSNFKVESGKNFGVIETELNGINNRLDHFSKNYTPLENHKALKEGVLELIDQHNYKVNLDRA